MKTRIALVTTLILLGAAAGNAQAQRLELDSLDRLAKQAVDSVNINIDQSLLGFASTFLKGSGDDAEVKKILSQLRGIYVRSFEFDRDVDPIADLDPIRKQLTGKGWVRLIGVDSKREREFVEVYSFRDGDISGGLAILAVEPNEVTVVNIIGPLDPSKLGALRGLGVPDIPDAR
jgi:hypothetical protein